MPYPRNEIQAKREERRKVGEDLRALINKAGTEKRAYIPEEQSEKDKLFARGEELRQTIEDMEKASDLLADDHPANRSAPATKPDDDPQTAAAIAVATDGADERKDPRNTPEYRKLFRQFLQAPNQIAANNVAQRALEFLSKRDLQVDNEQQAGVLVPPVEMVKEILHEFDNETPTRGLARVITVRQAKGLGIFKRLAKASTFAWGSEVLAPTKDTALRFGLRELHPHNATGEVVVSRDFMRQSDMAPEAIIRGELVRDGSELMEQGFLTGSGAANQPLGIYTAHADGISTARDVSTGNTATAVTLEGLRKAKFALNPGWWKTAAWSGNLGLLEQIYAMVDGIGRPIFVESLRIGEPDRVLNIPFMLNLWGPNTFTASQYVGVLADFKRGYLIADALDMEIERFDDSGYARTNQVGFIARLKTDGMPVLEEAFVRIKLAA